MHGESLDDWLPLTPLERLEVEVHAQWALYQELRAEVAELRAWLTALEAYRARENEE